MGLKIKVVALWIVALHLVIAVSYLISAYMNDGLGAILGITWMVLLIVAIPNIDDNWEDIESWYNNRQKKKKKNSTVTPPKGD